MADESYGQEALAMVNQQLADMEWEVRQSIAGRENDSDFMRERWSRFVMSALPLRQQRDLLVAAMVRVKAFEAPPPVILTNNPER